MSGRPGHDDPAVAAMTGWAQLLHDVVERRLRPGGPTDLLAPSWDGMFDDALAEVMQAMVAERLARLGPEEFVALYRSVRGDEAVLGDLQGLVDDRVRLAAAERRRVELVREATVAGRVRLADLAADETFDVGLFDPTRPDLAAWRFRDDAARRPLHRAFRVRLTDPAAGEGRVVTDTWRGAVWSERWRTPPVPPMTAVRLGTPVPESADLLPELTLHAPLALRRPDGGGNPAGIVGYVRTLDGRLLLDADPEAARRWPQQVRRTLQPGTSG